MNAEGMRNVQQMSSELCESEAVRNVATKLAPAAANALVTSVTGNPAAGVAAQTVVGGAAAVAPRAVAEVAVGTAIDACVPVVGAVVLAGAAVYGLAKLSNKIMDGLFGE